ncbi:MAG: hypothetical protein JWQ97_4106, partial [Phenylobacterium sp.]|nr:hypothetical protein [Phenylobacterium sp.]
MGDTAENAPDPLVPAECSMAGNDWFPLHFDRLRKSKWWRRASDLARARNVMLWGEAYKQVPGGSMPDDDDELAEAAGFGMDVEAFMAAKAEIMAPWTLCSDGRWYHPTVCEVVLEAWEKASERRKAAAAKKAAQRAKVRGQSPSASIVPRNARAVPHDSANVPEDNPETGRDIDAQERRGQDTTGHPSEPEGSAQSAVDETDDQDPLAGLRAMPIATGAWRLGLKVLMELGGQTETAARKVLGKFKQEGLTPPEMWEIAEAALDLGTPDPVPYLVKAA